MGIVLNEIEFVENVLQNYTLGPKPVETLTRIAKYYAHKNEMKKDDIRSALEEFMIRCDPTINLVKWQDTVDRIVRCSKKYNLVRIDSVQITDRELAICDSTNGKQAKRVLFTLICLAKYANLVNEKNDGWVNRPDKEIFKLANVVTPVKRQSLMLNDFREAGLIRFSRKVDNVNINVTCLDNSADVALEISDFRNLGYQYMRYCGESYIECAQCGLIIRRRSNAQKYCPDCAVDVNRQRTRERLM